MLNIVLFEPEIAENTGNIIRTCVGFNASLHLIRPYGFLFSKNDPKLKRSSANYLDLLEIHEHNSFEDFLKTIDKKSKIYYLTRYGIKNPSQCEFNKKENIYIVFGKESTGIDKNILLNNKKDTVRIPSTKNVRSLNLSNCVAMMCYEFSRQNEFNGLEGLEPHKKLF
jgi:tRNA (cytidine/uridine-2'-O-)-methyltransferase